MAPSLSPAALPAVTRPWARNGVFNWASASLVVPGPRRLVGGRAPSRVRLWRGARSSELLDLPLS